MKNNAGDDQRSFRVDVCQPKGQLVQAKCHVVVGSDGLSIRSGEVGIESVEGGGRSFSSAGPRISSL